MVTALALVLVILSVACASPEPLDLSPYQVADTAEPPMPARELLFEWAKGELPEEQLPLAVAITEGMSEPQLAKVQEDGLHMVIERLCAGEAASLEPYLDTTLLGVTATQVLPSFISASTAAFYLDALHTQEDSTTVRALRGQLWAVIDRAESSFTVNHYGCRRGLYLHLQALGATGAVGACESDNLWFDASPGEWRSYLWHAAELISHQPDALEADRLQAMLDGFEAATTADMEHYERLPMARALMRIAQHLDDPTWEEALLEWSEAAFYEELGNELRIWPTLIEYPPRHIEGLRELGHDDHALRLALHTVSALENSWPGAEPESWPYHRTVRGWNTIADLAVHLVQLDEPERGWALLEAQLADLEWAFQQMRAGRSGGWSNEYHRPCDELAEGFRVTAHALRTLEEGERAVQTMGSSAKVWLNCKNSLGSGTSAPFRTATDAELLMGWMDSDHAPDFDARELDLLLRASTARGVMGRAVGSSQGIDHAFWRSWMSWAERLPTGSERTELLARTAGFQAVRGAPEAVPALLDAAVDGSLVIIEQGFPEHHQPWTAERIYSESQPWKGIRWALPRLAERDSAAAQVVLERLVEGIRGSPKPHTAVFAALQISSETCDDWPQGCLALLEAAEARRADLEDPDLVVYLERQLEGQSTGRAE